MTPVDNIYGRKVYKVGSIVTSARRQRILEIRASKKYANINSKVSKHKWQSMFRYLARYVKTYLLRAYEYVNRGIANFYQFSRVTDVQEGK